MREMGRQREPMCETSEKGEKLISRTEMMPVALEIGRRILELFGYQKISNIVFRLKSNSPEISAVINGEILPSTELLLGIHRITGASIDWLLTGSGNKFIHGVPVVDPLPEPSAPPAVWFVNQETVNSLLSDSAIGP